MAVTHSTHVEDAGDKDGNGRRSSIVQTTEIDTNIAALDDEVFRRMSVALPNLDEVTKQAKDATDMEHDMTAWESVKPYPKAVLYSALMSLAISMGEFLCKHIPHSYRGQTSPSETATTPILFTAWVSMLKVMAPSFIPSIDAM